MPHTTGHAAFRLNPALRDHRTSATLAMNEAATRLAADGRKLYRLGFGQSPFPVPSPVVAALHAHAAEKDYLPVKGLPALRDAVASWHRRVDGIPATADDILIGPGSKELIFLTQLVCDADLLVPAPSWVSYAPQARLLGRPVQWIPTNLTDAWRLTPDALARACRDGGARARLLILNYPGNPSGTTLGEEHLAALARVARQHAVIVLADEIYGGLHHTGHHQSLALHYPEGTIVSGGLSKWCGAGGWRLGTLYVPPSLGALREAVACAASETYSTASAPIQHAAVTAFRGSREIDEYVHQSRRIVRALGRWAGQALTSAGANVAPAEGGFYVLPDFSPHHEVLRARGIDSGPTLCERLLVETGVALLPGAVFGRPVSELTCRLAFVDFDGAACLAAASALPHGEELDEPFLAGHCGDVLEAIRRVTDWLQSHG